MTPKHKSSYLNIILIIAVIVLYVLFFTNKTQNKEHSFVSNDSTAFTNQILPVAFVNIDTLLLQYNLSKDLNEKLMQKKENSQASYNQKVRQFQKEAEEFQQKYQNNAFLTQARMESEQKRLQKEQEDLQELNQQLSQELTDEMQNLNQQLRDSVYAYLKIYNNNKGYHLIFSNSMNDNIMISDDIYDITSDIVKGLNKRYAKLKE